MPERTAHYALHIASGQYRIPLHLGPRQTYNLDMMTLVKSRVPDADGNLIPDNITSGSAMLIGPKGELDNDGRYQRVYVQRAQCHLLSDLRRLRRPSRHLTPQLFRCWRKHSSGSRDDDTGQRLHRATDER